MSMSKSLTNTTLIESICKPTNRKNIIPYVLKFKPFRENTKKQIDVVWTADQIKKHNDRDYFIKMPLALQKSVKFILAFFMRADYIVITNLTFWLDQITNPEIIKGYRFQAFMEEEHAEMYGLLSEKYFEDEKEFEEVSNAIETFPVIKAKGDWALKYMNSKKTLGHVLVAFACVEGIHFQSSFAFIDWLKTQNYKLQMLYDSNNYISRDEGFHTEYAGLVNQVLDYPISLKECAVILQEALEIECLFVNELIPASGYTNMTRSMMYQHCKHATAIVANLLSPPSINYGVLYLNTSSPFEFMIKRSLQKKANFFEEEDTNYYLNNKAEGGNKKLSSNADF